MKKKELSEYFSKLAKRGNKMNPRPRSFFVEMGKKGAEAKKLSTLKKLQDSSR